MQTVTVNRALDFVERVGWMAIYGGAAAFIAWATTGDAWSWRTFLIAIGLAVCKVVIAQRVGASGMGDAIPGQVLTPPPVPAAQRPAKSGGVPGGSG